ncbi:hypothetical protein N7512_006360 [Penicillium capsulatum]|nr:hypothetical protein N7512_006360 [Penicillium capsulatum]
MKIPETTTTESPDVERATDNAGGNDILEPLQFLLAARRGVRADPTFTTTHVPDDRVLVYAGESGVESYQKSPRWSRFLCHVGYMGRPWLAGFWAFYMGFMISLFIHENETEEEDEQNDIFYTRLWTGGYAAAAVVIFLLAARVYAKKRMAAATPPPFDPESYQSRLVQALRQRDIPFREVVTTPFEEMEQSWRQDLKMQEKFRIEGLVDVDGSVYDLVVQFWVNGNVNFQFVSGQPEETPQNKCGVLLREKQAK